VATDEGDVVTPDEWTQFLLDIEKMELEFQAPVPQSLRTIPAAGTLVLAEETSLKDLLEKAKELYRLGLEQQAKGNYEQAQSYFNESLRYVEIYKSYAVKGVYTVRLIPERRALPLAHRGVRKRSTATRTCGRRSGGATAQADPEPDLIYPGWQLVIPLE